MMDIFMSETYWPHKKWNKIASDIKLVSYSSVTRIYFAYIPECNWHIFQNTYTCQISSMKIRVVSFTVYIFLFHLSNTAVTCTMDFSDNSERHNLPEKFNLWCMPLSRNVLKVSRCSSMGFYLTLCTSKWNDCCIPRCPGGERIVDVPGVTGLEPQVKTGSWTGRTHLQ